MEAIYPSALTIDKESVDDPFREEVGGWFNKMGQDKYVA